MHELSFEVADLLMLAEVKGVVFDNNKRLYVFKGSKAKLRAGMVKAGLIHLL